MQQNIVKQLKNRETKIQFHPEKFVEANYFNESMIKRLRVEREIPLDFETSGDLVSCGSWNHDGSLLACGKKGRGVDVYSPFRSCERQAAIPIKNNHNLADVVFMPRSRNLMAVTSRNKNSLIFWITTADVLIDDYVKVWDVDKSVATRTYGFKGPVTKLITSNALPNHIWFNTDNKVKTIAEADIRSPKYQTLKLDLAKDESFLGHRRCFDVHPVDGVTVAVGDKSDLLFYDRRTMTSQAIAKPFKSFDASSVNTSSSFISEIRYDPGGSKIIFGNSSYDHYVIDLDASDVQGLAFKNPTNTVTRNPKFLGDNYVLFDTFYKNYSVFFDLKEAKIVSKLKLAYQRNFFSNILSIPHPNQCMVVVIYQDILTYLLQLV